MTTRPISRRDFSACVALASTVVVSRSLFAQSRLERPKLFFAVVGRSSIPLLPLTLAERLGYFRAEGLDVEMIDFPSAGSALQAIISGSVQVGVSGYEQILGVAARGHFLQSFVLMGRLPAVAMGISTRNLPHFKTVADLKGKRVGVGAPGSASHAIAHWVLTGAGLTLGDVSLVHLESGAEALAAFQSGQIDALSYGDPVVTMLEQKRAVHLVADSRTWKGSLALFGGPIPSACLYAHGAFLQQNPLMAQAMTTAVVRALKWLQTAGPSDMMKTIPESFMLGDRALYLTAISKGRDAVSPDGLMPKAGPKLAHSVFTGLESAAAPTRIDLERTYTNEFATLANAHFKA
jgi:NitT/TauT family transport system substrate-binding protein